MPLRVEVTKFGPICAFDHVRIALLNPPEAPSPSAAPDVLTLDEQCVAQGELPQSLLLEDFVATAERANDTAEPSASLRAVVLASGELRPSAQARHVAITPFSELAAAWSQSGSSREAHVSSQRRLSDFLATPLQPDGPLTERLQQLSDGFVLLSARLADPRVLERPVADPESVFATLKKLGSDGADGTLDGRDGTAQLEVAGQLLSATELRDALSDSLLNMAREPARAQERAALEALAESIAQSDSTLIARSRSLFDTERPVLWACRAIGASNEHLPLSRLQSQGRKLVCQVRSAERSRLRSLQLHAEKVDLSEALHHCEQHGRNITCDIGDLSEVEGVEAELTAHFDSEHAGQGVATLGVALDHPRPRLDREHHVLAVRDDATTKTLTFTSSRALLSATLINSGGGLREGGESLELMRTSEEEGPEFRYSIVVPLPAASGAERGTLSLTDAAGWSVPLGITRVRHAQAPIIDDMQGHFVGDFDDPRFPREVALRWDGDEVVFNKLAYRLDYLPTRNAFVANNKLPALTFAAHSTVTQDDPGAHHNALSVEYRLTELAGASVEMPWRPVVQLGVGHYELPLAYQTLLDPELLAQGRDAVRAHNPVGRAQPHERFALEVRATDVAGNEAIRTFTFSLNLRGDPLLIENCAPSIASKSVAYDRITELLTGQSPLMRPRLRPQGLTPEFSLAPEPNYSVVVGGMQPLSLDSHRLRRTIANTEKPLAPEQSQTAYLNQVREAKVGTGIYRASRLGYGGGVVCYGQSDCHVTHEDKSHANVIFSQHLDGIPLHDVRVAGVSQGKGETIELRLNREDSTQKFPLISRSIANRSAPELLLNADIGQIITKYLPAGRLERVETIKALSLRLPNVRVELQASQDGTPQPLEVVRDASCSAQENERVVLEFDSPNGLND